MKALFLSVLVAASALAAFGADAPSVAGKWAVHISIAGNEADIMCTLASKDNTITGTCAGEQGTNEVTGKIDGNKVSWGYKSEYNGGPLTMAYQGMLDGNNMKGSVSVVEYSVDGEFSAVQAKEEK